jgi:hypothetical protein
MATAAEAEPRVDLPSQFEPETPFVGDAPASGGRRAKSGGSVDVFVSCTGSLSPSAEPSGTGALSQRGALEDRGSPAPRGSLHPVVLRLHGAPGLNLYAGHGHASRRSRACLERGVPRRPAHHGVRLAGSRFAGRPGGARARCRPVALDVPALATRGGNRDRCARRTSRRGAAQRAGKWIDRARRWLTGSDDRS